MDEEPLKIVQEGEVLWVTLNRPERLNALVGHMRRDLAEALEEAGSDPHVRVVVLGGEGRAFCAGGDVNFMAELVERGEAEEFTRLLGAARRVGRELGWLGQRRFSGANRSCCAYDRSPRGGGPRGASGTRRRSWTRVSGNGPAFHKHESCAMRRRSAI